MVVVGDRHVIPRSDVQVSRDPSIHDVYLAIPKRDVSLVLPSPKTLPAIF